MNKDKVLGPKSKVVVRLSEIGTGEITIDGKPVQVSGLRFESRVGEATLLVLEIPAVAVDIEGTAVVELVGQLVG